MKPFIIIALLFALTNCGEKLGSKSTAQSSINNTGKQRTALSEHVLKYVKYSSNVLALTHARVIDGTGRPAKIDQTLIISDGYIQAIGKSGELDIPKNATTINLSGKTVIPGIVGLHNHLHIPGFPFVGEVASKLYLAAGVTTIQTCGSASPQKEIELAERVEKGEFAGSDIITSGPYFTGSGGNPNMIIPRDEKHIRDTIQHWTNKGVRWFKVYRNTRPNDLKVIIDEAHKQNAKVTGHLCSITFEQATKLGIDGIEHGLNSASDFRKNKTFGVCDGSRGYIDSIDISAKEVKQLQQFMIDEDVFLTSTLAIYESSIPKRAYADERSIAAMSPFLLAQYQERRKRYDSLQSTENTREARLKRIMAFERQFFEMGGTLTAGVDAGRHVLPGFGDQRNYELLIEAGFSTEEAIQIMTGNGAEALERNDIGIIQEGKRADFVILNGILEQDASVIKKVETVFKNGFGYDTSLLLKTVQGQFGKE
ncbi:MAG: amidohydrolase [Flavobacteriales bacterium]|nr:amidohydrolase [Flavobacteriales bacterium]|tara:strand:- start:868 stop:2313 length:1446 start_codon:yes stop_codon:yes gene_type:complete